MEDDLGAIEKGGGASISRGFYLAAANLLIPVVLCVSLVGVYLAFAWVLFVLPIGGAAGLACSLYDQRRRLRFSLLGVALGAIALAVCLSFWSLLNFQIL